MWGLFHYKDDILPLLKGIPISKIIWSHDGLKGPVVTWGPKPPSHRIHYNFLFIYFFFWWIAKTLKDLLGALTMYLMRTQCPSYQMSIKTPKLREIHGCILNTVATDTLVLKHQAISIPSVDKSFIVLDHFTPNITFIVDNISKWNYLLQNEPVVSLRPSDAYMRRWTNHHWFR